MAENVDVQNEGSVETATYCPVHPEKEAFLRCIRCERLMCPECTVRTSVGYICKECARKSDDKFYQAGNNDYLIVFAITAALTVATNTAVALFSFGFFGFIIAIFAGGAAGQFIGRTARRQTKGRVGRYSWQVAVGGVAVGALLSPTLFILLRFGVLIFMPTFLFDSLPMLICSGVIGFSVYNVWLRRI